MTTSREANETRARMRVALANGYAMVKGMAAAVSLSSATLEQMMQERIDEIMGPGRNPRRPSLLERVRKTRRELTDTIAQIRSMPPDALNLQESSDQIESAITPEEG